MIKAIAKKYRVLMLCTVETDMKEAGNYGKEVKVGNVIGH